MARRGGGSTRSSRTLGPEKDFRAVRHLCGPMSIHEHTGENKGPSRGVGKGRGRMQTQANRRGRGRG